MRQADTADTLLARFPGPVTLVPSRLKLSVGLAICAGLTAFCVAVLVPRLPYVGWYDSVMTVFAIPVCGGLAVRAAILLLLPGTVGLTLNTDGFEIGGFFRRRRTPWREASGFRVAADADNFRVIKYEVPGKAKRPRAKLTRMLWENYRLPKDDLARLLAEWRERALAFQRSHHSVVPHIAPPE